MRETACPHLPQDLSDLGVTRQNNESDHSSPPTPSVKLSVVVLQLIEKQLKKYTLGPLGMLSQPTLA